MEDKDPKKEDEKAPEAEQEPATEKPEGAVKPEDSGSKEEKPNLIEQAKEENDRKEKLLEEEKALQDRKEKLHAEQMVGGKASMSAEEPPKKLTDTEYAEALERGEVNPLKEDGFIK